MIFQTKRLILKEIENEHFESLYENIFNDENVYKYTFGSDGFSKNEAYEFLKNQQNKIFSLKSIIQISTNLPIGLSGVLPYEDSFEIGFILQKSSWKMGFAQEIANGQLKYIKYKLNKQKAYALAHANNENSINCILRLGFVHVKSVIHNERQRELFEKNL